MTILDCDDANLVQDGRDLIHNDGFDEMFQQ
jgi:hypothetical protein